MANGDEPTVESRAARLEELRKRLAKARSDNLEAVAEEGRQPRHRPSDKRSALGSDEAGDSGSYAVPVEREPHQAQTKRKRKTAAVGTENEPDEMVSKAMRKRLARMRRTVREEVGLDIDSARLRGEGNDVDVVAYGGKGPLVAGAAERVAKELADVERRRKKAKKESEFDEETADIGFINEPNRKFNAMLDKHYDKYESVRDVKESLERGTALP